MVDRIEDAIRYKDNEDMYITQEDIDMVRRHIQSKPTYQYMINEYRRLVHEYGDHQRKVIEKLVAWSKHI